jgi:hypothetical protein
MMMMTMMMMMMMMKTLLKILHKNYGDTACKEFNIESTSISKRKNCNQINDRKNKCIEMQTHHIQKNVHDMVSGKHIYLRHGECREDERGRTANARHAEMFNNSFQGLF